MKLKLNKFIWPMIILTLSISLEYFPELFNHIPFKYEVLDNSGYVFDTTWKEPIWFLNQGLLTLACVIYSFVLVPKGWIAIKYLMLAPISWWIIESYQKFCWLIKMNDNRLYVNDDSIWQMSLIVFIVLGAIYGFTNFKS